MSNFSGESDEVFDEMDELEDPDYLSFSATREPLFDDGFDYGAYGLCGMFRPNRQRCGASPIAWVLKRVKRRVDGRDRFYRIPMFACPMHYKDKDRTNDIYLVQTSTDYSKGEASPYWNAVERSGATNEEGESLEYVKNNPDILAESKSPWVTVPLAENLVELAERTMKATEALTPKQKEVFDLLVYERRNQYEIAALLGLERVVVQKRIDGIVKKLSALGTIQNGSDAISSEGGDTDDRST